MATLFISDLHLSEHTPELTELFLQFLQFQAPQAEALYILGDFFEMWLGDDDLSSYNKMIIQALRQLSELRPVYLMTGNRDFMIGQRFALASGCQLLPDPALVNLYGQTTLLAHGDLLCTQDKLHLRFRRLLQNRSLQRILLSLPLSWRYKIARGLRRQSKQRNQRLSATMMDVNRSALQSVMQHYGVKQLIHGHTHQPSIDYFQLDPSAKHQLVHSLQARRIVLNDWDERGNVLVYLPDHQLRLTTIAGAKQFIDSSLIDNL